MVTREVDLIFGAAGWNGPVEQLNMGRFAKTLGLLVVGLSASIATVPLSTTVARADEVITIMRSDVSCRRWIKARSNHGNERAVLENWVLGFVQAFNLIGDPRNGLEYKLSNEDIFGLVDKQCAQTGWDSLDGVTLGVLQCEIEKVDAAREGRPRHGMCALGIWADPSK